MTDFRTRQLLRYSWPMALSSLGGIAVGVTDTLIIGRYSTDALAGVALGASFYELLANSLLGGLMAYRIIAPRTTGTDGSQAGPVGLERTLRVLLPAALALSVGLIALTDLLPSHTGDPVMQAAADYLRGRSLSLVAETLSTALVITLLAWSRTRVPLLVFSLSSGVNLVLDVTLVYGLGPFPELGALGDGLASTIGAFVPVPWLIAQVVLGARARARASRATEQQFDRWGRLALPAVLSAIVDYGGNLLFYAILASAGAASLAGARVGAMAHVLVFVVISSMSSASLIMLGRMYSDDTYGLIASRSKVRSRFLVAASLIGACIVSLSWPLAVLVSADPEVQCAAVSTMIVVGVLCLPAGWAYANVSLLRAMGRTASDFTSNAVSVWVVQVPIAVLGQASLGGVGAFLGLLAYWLARAFITELQVNRLVPNR